MPCLTFVDEDAVARMCYPTKTLSKLISLINIPITLIYYFNEYFLKLILIRNISWPTQVMISTQKRKQIAILRNFNSNSIASN